MRSLLILATLRRFVLGTRKKQTIPAFRASRLVHPQAMGTILVPHSNTSISYRGPCIALYPYIHTYTLFMLEIYRVAIELIYSRK